MLRSVLVLLAFLVTLPASESARAGAIQLRGELDASQDAASAPTLAVEAGRVVRLQLGSRSFVGLRREYGSGGSLSDALEAQQGSPALDPYWIPVEPDDRASRAEYFSRQAPRTRSTATTTGVPEATALALLGAALGALLVARRDRAREESDPSALA